MGVDWSLREGYAWAEDKEHCEEYGRMLQADQSKVSSKAKKRGLPQVSFENFAPGNNSNLLMPNADARLYKETHCVIFKHRYHRRREDF